MGEEEKKPEEAQKVEERQKEEGPKAEKPGGDGKKEERKTEETKAEEQKPAPPPPPQEIVLKVYMHCEGCARKVRRCLKGFEGVEDVSTDCRTSKVVVKGEKADPLKVLERVQKKSHRQVELISPIPKHQSEEPKNPEEKAAVKVEEKKEEPPVITVMLGVYMHCEACAQEIKKRIQKMKGVGNAEPDLKSSRVIVKGVFEPEKLIDYIYKRTGKHAVIIQIEPEKKEEEKKEGKVEKKEEKKAEEGEKQAKKCEEDGKENKESGGGGGGGEPPAKVETEPDESKLELKRNEFYYHQYPQNYYHQYPQNYQVYPQRYVHESNEYPPQIFSDENPNACSVM